VDAKDETPAPRSCTRLGGHAEIAELLDKGANPNARNDYPPGSAGKPLAHLSRDNHERADVCGAGRAYADRRGARRRRREGQRQVYYDETALMYAAEKAAPTR